MKSLITFILILLNSSLIFGETHLVSVGINKYLNPDSREIWHSESDASRIASFYYKGKGKVTLITGQKATKEGVLAAMKQKFLNVKPEDKIILFFSGHGYPGGFVPYDANIFSNTCLSYEEIIEIMEESPAHTKIIFANACYSGTIRDEKLFNKSQTGNVLFFMASRSDEISWENSGMENSYFVHYLLKALKGEADANKDKKLTASEIFKYVSKKVNKETNGIQHPVMWGKFPDDLVIVEYKKN